MAFAGHLGCGESMETKLLEVMEIEVEKGGGAEKKSEPNLWKVVEDGDPDEVLHGLLMTYVDDLFVVGPSVVVDAVKHNGMEVQKGREEESGREVWAIAQESYVRNFLEGGGWEKKMKKIPISKDQSIMQPDVEKPEIERIRSSQKQVCTHTAGRSVIDKASICSCRDLSAQKNATTSTSGMPSSRDALPSSEKPRLRTPAKRTRAPAATASARSGFLRSTLSAQLDPGAACTARS